MRLSPHFQPHKWSREKFRQEMGFYDGQDREAIYDTLLLWKLLVHICFMIPVLQFSCTYLWQHSLPHAR